MEETINGVRNAERVAISKAERFTAISSDMLISQFAVNRGLVGRGRGREVEEIGVMRHHEILPEPIDKIENKTYDNANDDARSNWKINCNMFTLDKDVSRQLA